MAPIDSSSQILFTADQLVRIVYALVGGACTLILAMVAIARWGFLLYVQESKKNQERDRKLDEVVAFVKEFAYVVPRLSQFENVLNLLVSKMNTLWHREGLSDPPPRNSQIPDDERDTPVEGVRRLP